MVGLIPIGIVMYSLRKNSSDVWLGRADGSTLNVFSSLKLGRSNKKPFICSVRLMARSSPSQGEDIGSNPLPNNLDTYSNIS